MSAELTKARQQLSQVRTYLRQDSPVSAAQALQSALVTFMKNPLIKSERDELENLITDACHYIGVDETVRKHFALEISYTPGQERALHDVLRDLMAELSKVTLDDAQERVRMLEQRKHDMLARAGQELSSGQISKGKLTLSNVCKDFPDDAALRGSAGELLMNAQCYEEAVDFLSAALDMKPDMLPLYNTIGIGLRKLKRFETAETYFLRASQYLRHDPNLYFNIGRLYLDWKKYDKAIKSAEMALKLDSQFVEAQKLLTYVKKLKDEQGGKR